MIDRRKFFGAVVGLTGGLLALFAAPRDETVSITVNVTPHPSGKPTILFYELPRRDPRDRA